MSRRIPSDTANAPAAARAVDQNRMLRRQLTRRTQLRIQTRRRQIARLRDEALIRQAQHAIPHATRSESRRARREQLPEPLARHTPHTHVPAGRQLADPTHHLREQQQRLPEQTPITWLAPPNNRIERDTGGNGGTGGRQSDAPPEREPHQNTPGRPARRPVRGVHAIGAAPARRLHAATHGEHTLQHVLEVHHRDPLTREPLVAQAWAEALLSAVDQAVPPQSAVDAALACQSDLLAAWQHHGDSVELKQGALLPLFLAALHAHVAPASGPGNKPYALLPLMLISGFRYRSSTQLQKTRAHIDNLRLARVPQAPR